MLPYGLTQDYDSGALAASGIIRATPGRLHQIVIVNTKNAQQYLQLFNTTTVPANGVAPNFPPILLQPNNLMTIIDNPTLGYLFTVGICWSNSTSRDTKTLGSADVWVHAIHIGAQG